MPVNLNPEIVAFDYQMEKGALVRNVEELPRGGGAGQGGSGSTTNFAGDVLLFQYNPETVTRSRTGRWEPRKQRRRPVPSPQEVRSRSGNGSAALMAESETISMKIIFDATEAILAGRGYLDGEENSVARKGILPQLAFLDLVSLGKEEEQSRGRGQRTNRESARPIRPDELLLVLGRERLFPVVITSLTITEQKFSPLLVPIRAEMDIKMNVLEPIESVYSNWVKSAFDQLFDKRRTASQLAVESGDVLAIINRALSPHSQSDGQAQQTITA